jgi:predicted 2-oxoglutarate/Fe(II)-dependent dioxygenase YbiX
MIFQITETVTYHDCQRLITMYNRQAHLTDVRGQTGHPVVHWSHLQDAPDVNEIIPRLVAQCLRHLSNALDLADLLYPEAVLLAALGPGGYHSKHADNCRQNETGDWVPNHTPQRDASAIYYLNDAFEGGEIAFDRERVVVKPRRGLLLAFPSDSNHVHEVLSVRSGVRYTMPIWFTKEKAFALTIFRSGDIE